MTDSKFQPNTFPTSVSEVTQPVSGAIMHKEYVKTIGRLAYVWGWPLVNSFNRRAGITQAPEPGRLGGVVPVAPRRRICMNRPHSITADVEIPEEGAEGVIFSHGGSDGGYSLYMKGGLLHYVHNYVAKEYFHVESSEQVPAGRHQLRFEFEVTGPPDIHAGKGTPGLAQLYFDGNLVGQAEFPYTTPLVFGVAGGALECGMDSGSPVTPEYAPPFEFTGTIDSVTVDVSGDLIKDSEAEIRQIMARQ